MEDTIKLGDHLVRATVLSGLMKLISLRENLGDNNNENKIMDTILTDPNLKVINTLITNDKVYLDVIKRLTPNIIFDWVNRLKDQYHRGVFTLSEITKQYQESVYYVLNKLGDIA